MNLPVNSQHQSTPITGSMLYDLVVCPHRVTMDLFGNPSERDQVSPFVQLLWKRGAAHEQEVISHVTDQFIDLTKFPADERERRTLEAMDRGEVLIYGGRIAIDGLLGDPDLLRRDGAEYIPGDIKSGAGEEGASDGIDGKPKKHYAVQLALYSDILGRLGRSSARRAFVWDVHGDEISYDFTASLGRGKHQTTLWDYYQECLKQAREIVNGALKTLPAYNTGTCKNLYGTRLVWDAFKRAMI